ARADLIRGASLGARDWTASTATPETVGREARMRRIVVRYLPEVVDALDQAARAHRAKRAAFIRGAVMSLYPARAVAIPLPSRCEPGVRASTSCDAVPLPPGRCPMCREARWPSLRELILSVMSAEPDAVFTAARLAEPTGWENRDSLRNALLV